MAAGLSTATFPLPIAFTEFYQAVATDTGSGASSIGITSTTTNITAYKPSGWTSTLVGFRYIAVGKV